MKRGKCLSCKLQRERDEERESTTESIHLGDCITLFMLITHFGDDTNLSGDNLHSIPNSKPSTGKCLLVLPRARASAHSHSF